MRVVMNPLFGNPFKRYRVEKKVKQLQADEQWQELADFVMGLPERQRDNYLLVDVADAYNHLGRYRESYDLIRTMRGGSSDWMWLYCVGVSHYYLAEQAKGNPKKERRLRQRAKEMFEQSMLHRADEAYAAKCQDYLRRIDNLQSE